MSVVDNEYFCAAPWTSVYVDPDGTVDNCCVAKNRIGNVNTDNINDVVAGPKLLAVKQTMLSNQPAAGCTICWNSSHKFQTFFNSEYSKLGPDYFSNTDNFSLKYLDLRWNNTCNLACIYCGPGYSSLWADIAQKENKSIPIIPADQKTRNHRESLLEFITQNINTVEHIYLAGGEPLMLKENVEVLDAVLKANNNCRIVVNSNIAELNTPVFDRLKQYHNVQWLISGEATGAAYEYIRWPGVWENYYNNIKTISQIKDHYLTFNFVAMNLNALNMWDFADLLKQDFGVEHTNISVNVYNLRDPRGAYSLHRLPETVKQEVRDRAKDYQVIGLSNFLEALDDVDPESPGLEKTHTNLLDLDCKRNLNSRIIFKHLY